MLKYAIALSLFGTASLLATDALAATAQDNHAPVCSAKTIQMAPMSPDLNISSLGIDVINVAPVCSDEDGDSLTLVSVSDNARINAQGQAEIDQTLLAGDAVTITFTVSDNKGGQATSTLTVYKAKIAIVQTLKTF